MAHAPGSPRAARIAAALMLLSAVIAVLLTSAAGCRKEAPQGQVSEDAAERAKKAAALYHKASATPIPEKYEMLRRLTAVYDDTPRGQDAYFDLVVLLVRDRPPQLDEALKIARTFRDRHPADPRVGESFMQIVDIAYARKDEASRAAALADWSNHLEARDVAGDLPKPWLYYDMVRLRLRQERWKDADVAIQTALDESGQRPEDRIELLVRRGNLLAEKLGDVPGGRAAFQQALELARKLSSGGPRGIPPDQIEAELKKLEDK